MVLLCNKRLLFKERNAYKLFNIITSYKVSKKIIVSNKDQALYAESGHLSPTIHAEM